MKKQEYSSPDTTCVSVEIESTLCLSGLTMLAGMGIEGFDTVDTDFAMFDSML